MTPSIISAALALSLVQPQGPLAKTIHQAAPVINIEVVQRAADAVVCEKSKGEINPTKLAIVDFSLPNTTPRMWVLDLEKGVLLSTQVVSHGSGSGGSAIPSRFSNIPGSNASSLGLYKVAERYQQIKGVALDAGPAQTHGLDPYPRARLDGLFPGVNDLARDRAVVIHSSQYVSKSRAGLSQGCFTLDRGDAIKTVATLANGQALYADAPDTRFQAYMKTLSQTCQAVLDSRRDPSTYPELVAKVARLGDANYSKKPVDWQERVSFFTIKE